MIGNTPRVLAINDLSGFGRVALSAVIPILSCMGSQVVPLPTVLLSSSGAYPNFTYLKLTDNMKNVINHWVELGVAFDAILTGFIGDTEQIEIVKAAIDKFKQNEQLVVVDPVMADGGKLYSFFNLDFVASMRDLISKANIITPNITEASLLINNEIDLSQLSQENMKNWAVKLSDLGPETVIITSIPDEITKDSLCVIGYEKRFHKFWKVSASQIPGSYPGTGDSFTSVLVGSLLQGNSLPISLSIAVNYISTAIQQTHELSHDSREGILLEKTLYTLSSTLSSISYEEI